MHRGKPVAYSVYERSTDAPSYQLGIADAAAPIDTAVLHAYRSADEIDAAARDGVQLDELARARVRSDLATVATRCREAVGLLLNVGGASSFAQANPLQRVWRDLEIIARHGLANVNIGRSTGAPCSASPSRSAGCSDRPVQRRGECAAATTP